MQVVTESSINAGSGDPNGVATKSSTAEYGFRPTQPKIDVWVAGKKCSLISSAMGSVPMGCNYTITVNAKGEISGELRAGNAVCTQTADIAKACGQSGGDQGERVSLKSVISPDRYVRHRNYLGELTPISSELDRKDGTFMVRPGLAGGDSISFESVNFPGFYLRHQGYRIKLHKADGSDLFKKDASFNVRAGVSGEGRSFESVNYPSYYLRHCSFNMWIDNNARGNNQCDPNPAVFHKDVSFEVVPGLYN